VLFWGGLSEIYCFSITHGFYSSLEPIFKCCYSKLQIEGGKKCIFDILPCFNVFFFIFDLYPWPLYPTSCWKESRGSLARTTIF
jgi:hypothetical protein